MQSVDRLGRFCHRILCLMILLRKKDAIVSEDSSFSNLFSSHQSCFSTLSSSKDSQPKKRTLLMLNLMHCKSAHKHRKKKSAHNNLKYLQIKPTHNKPFHPISSPSHPKSSNPTLTTFKKSTNMKDI